MASQHTPTLGRIGQGGWRQQASREIFASGRLVRAGCERGCACLMEPFVVQYSQYCGGQLGTGCILAFSNLDFRVFSQCLHGCG